MIKTGLEMEVRIIGIINETIKVHGKWFKLWEGRSNQDFGSQ